MEYYLTLYIVLSAGFAFANLVLGLFDARDYKECGSSWLRDDARKHFIFMLLSFLWLPYFACRAVYLVWFVFRGR